MITPTGQLRDTSVQRRRTNGRWVICLLVGLVASMAYLLGRWVSISDTFASEFQSPEMAAIQYSKRTVHANLGGIKVAIPSHFAEYVEYDNDPGWGEKRKGPIPVRTSESRLRSFGFYVRYPNMEGLSNPEMWKDKRSHRNAETPWLSVGINTGQNYPGDGFMDRGANARVGVPNKINPVANYEKLPDRQYNLEVYVPTGIDPKTSQPYRHHDSATDVFIHRGKSGKVETQIECSNRNVSAPPCRQHFSLEPKAKAWVYVSYRRSMLQEWRGIQDSVRNLIFSFELNPQAPDGTSPVAPNMPTTPYIGK